MGKKYETSIFIFRRALRLTDNIGLLEALKNSDTVIPIFIFTPTQLEKNSYKSDNCVQFMIESLIDLNNQLNKRGSRLFYFYGEPHDIINKLIKDNKKIDGVFINVDYTQYSIKRDKLIKRACENYDVSLILHEDILLNPIKSILTGDNTVYEKFTPYYNKAIKQKVQSPIRNNYSNYLKKTKKIKGEYKGSIHKFYKKNNNIAENGGRDKALIKFKIINNNKKYNRDRNILHIKTTRLSAYIKFGCVSIREVYNLFRTKLGMSNNLIKQLYWRDFYYNISYEHPRVFIKGKNMKEEYDNMDWKKNITYIQKWKKGTTGYPIIDAAMRELNTTGYMHNRGRLLTSNFLVKVLGINWEIGEKYYAQKLIDYDPSVNNGNWQWSSGSGADSQPYFRIFNPWLQSKKHDKDCIYIKKWLPELKKVINEDIHEWYETYDYEEYKNINYPEPMVDYKKNKQMIIKMYKRGLY
jgi:deoxyribodipyrimidine photo-lyase